MLWKTENGITGHLSLFLVKPVQLRVEQRLSSRTNCANLYCPAAQGEEPSSFSDPWLYSLLSSSKVPWRSRPLSVALEEEHEAALEEWLV